MSIFGTEIFTNVSAIFNSLWGETAGKILLTTYFAYSASYMIYSGYISWFAGGYGGLLLSQVGFTAIDFLSLVPTTFLLIVESIWIFIQRVWKYLVLYIILPLVFSSLLGRISETWSTHGFSVSKLTSWVGFGIWIIGVIWGWYLVRANQRVTSIIPILLVVVGTILLSIFFVPSTPILPDPGSIPQNSSQSTDILLEISALALLLLVPTLPFMAGLRMARFATEKRLLSRLTKIILKQSIQIPGMLQMPSAISETPSSSIFVNVILLFSTKKKSAPSSFAYQLDVARPVYLVASFNRFTALYATSDATDVVHGKMVILPNDLIYSMEIEGRQNRVNDRVAQDSASLIVSRKSER